MFEAGKGRTEASEKGQKKLRVLWMAVGHLIVALWRVWPRWLVGAG